MRSIIAPTLLLLAACSAPSPAPRVERLTAVSTPEAPEAPVAPEAVEPAESSPAPAAALAPAYGIQSSSGRSQGEGRRRQSLDPGDTLLQGYVGALFIDSVEVEGSTDLDYLEEPDFDELVALGGGGQWVLGGERIDFGLEGGLSFNFSTGGGAVLVGGGGAAVAVDVDLLIADVYGGLFASTFLGDTLRLYGGVGPLLQFADYEQEGDSFADDGSGFGVGYYVRAGVEFVLASRTMLGVGARWSDSTVDLGGGLNDLEVSGTQAFVSVTTGL